MSTRYAFPSIYLAPTTVQITRLRKIVSDYGRHLEDEADKEAKMAAAASVPAATSIPPATTKRRARPSSNLWSSQPETFVSEDTLVRNHARDAAEKEATGSGKRVRVPSRKALEASGQVAPEAPQLMTAEQKAQRDQVNQQRALQRKMYKRAGFTPGTVLEASPVGIPAMTASADVVDGGDDIGQGGGEGEGGEGGGGGEEPQVDREWYRVPPAMLSVPPVQEQM